MGLMVVVLGVWQPVAAAAERVMVQGWKIVMQFESSRTLQKHRSLVLVVPSEIVAVGFL